MIDVRLIAYCNVCCCATEMTGGGDCESSVNEGCRSGTEFDEHEKFWTCLVLKRF